MALQVLLADRDVTTDASGLTYSSVDPGGFEACTFTLPSSVAQPKPGDPVRVMEGVALAWEGMVEDPGPTEANQRAEAVVQAVGYGAKLKDDPYQMVYVDRDVSRWHASSTAAQTRRVTVDDRALGTVSSLPDQTDGNPSVKLSLQGPWVTAGGMSVDAWYDAGAGCTIKSIYYDLTTAAGASGGFDASDPDWFVAVSTRQNDDFTGGSSGTTDLAGSIPTPGTHTPGPPYYRLGQIELTYVVAGGADGVEYVIFARNLAVYGDHPLTKRGTDPPGFYAEDIAIDALNQTTGIDIGVVEASGFIVPHVVYRDPTLPEKVIDDMANLLGWHWGVWESLSILDSTPRLDFRARPASATAVVSRADCDGLTITERRSQLYDEVIVTYTDAAGTPGQVTVTAENPRMPAGTSRTLGPLNIGISSSGAASDYAADALSLAQSSQRGGGSPTLPANVRLPGGGSKPAHLLRAGLDRLKITDLPDSGSWTESDTRRFDTFRVKRVETTVDNGAPKTRVELDEGADLLEVLNARQAIGAVVSGA